MPLQQKEGTMKSQRMIILAIASLALAACADSADTTAPSNVTFDVQLIEVKGATDGIDPPDTNPTELSAGYGFKPPGEFNAENPNEWQVATYMFAPGAMSVVKGDHVTLRIFGVNGNNHTLNVQAPDGSTVVESFVIERGREVTVDFTAEQSGHYKFICANHAPTMTADIFSTEG
jgi:plastocyanin